MASTLVRTCRSAAARASTYLPRSSQMAIGRTPRNGAHNHPRLPPRMRKRSVAGVGIDQAGEPLPAQISVEIGAKEPGDDRFGIGRIARDMRGNPHFGMMVEPMALGQRLGIGHI